MKPIEDCEIKKKATASMDHFLGGMVTRKDKGNEKRENSRL